MSHYSFCYSLKGRDNTKSLEIFHRLPSFPFGPSLVWPMFATRTCSLASTADLIPNGRAVPVRVWGRQLNHFQIPIPARVLWAFTNLNASEKGWTWREWVGTRACWNYLALVSSRLLPSYQEKIRLSRAIYLYSDNSQHEAVGKVTGRY